MAGPTAKTISRMGSLLFLAIVRAPATGERAESLAVASGSNLGLVAPSPVSAADLLAPLPRVMAPQALAFPSATRSQPLSFAIFLHVARPPLRKALAK
jgi:hypothetical protein